MVQARLAFVLLCLASVFSSALLLNCSTSDVHPPIEGQNYGLDASIGGDASDGTIARTDVTISPDESVGLDIGNIECGQTGKKGQVSITNNASTGTISFTVALTRGDAFYAVGPLTGQIAAGETVKIAITPNQIPTTSPVGPDTYAGTLKITTTAPNDPPHILPIKQSARGAILQSTLQSPAIAFGNIGKGLSGTLQFNVSNTGNEAATIRYQVANPAIFGVAVTPSATIGPSESASVTVTFNPANLQAYNDTASLSVVSDADAGTPTAALCSSLPPNVTLSGTGVAVEQPAMTTSLDAVDFGQVNCGTAGQPQTFAVNNTAATDFTLDGKFRKGTGSIFQLAGTGVIPGHGQTTLTISMINLTNNESVVADARADVLTLQATNGGGTVSKDIPVHITARGAILRFSPTALDFGSVPVNTSPTAPFTLRNDGNADAEVDLTLAPTGTSTSTFTRSPLGPQTVTPSTPLNMTATFTASDTLKQTATLGMTLTSSPTNVLCADLPADMALSGSGSNSTVSISPASTDIYFGNAGLVDCGARASAQTLQLSNTGSSSFTFNASLPSGGSYYQVSPTSGTVLAGQTVPVTVTPNAIPSTSAITTDLYSGTLSISTTASNDSVHLYQLHQTAHGAILQQSAASTIAFGGVALNQTSTQQYNITNVGNLDATVTLSKANAVFGITNSMPLAIAKGQNAVAVVTFTPPQAQSYTDTITASASAAASAFCGPALANVALTGTGTTGVSLTPTSLNFGVVNCGAAAAPKQTFSLTNNGATMNFTPTFGKGGNTPYTLQYTTGQSAPYTGAITAGSPYQVGAGTTVSIDVIPRQITAPASTAANGFGDTLTITTDSPGDTAHNVQLTETAQGASLSVSPSYYIVLKPAPGATDFYPFTITNSGNFQVNYSIVASSVSNAASGAFGTNVSSGSLAGSSSTSGLLLKVINDQANTNFTTVESIGNLTISATGSPVLCSDPIPPIVVTVCNNQRVQDPLTNTYKCQ